ncbi:hypothetical protein DID88_004572 [Monilinia fructigena]|uniref:Uncharacterized protein n=1 Tax=Monilinia fructigena TaxID=38457 RepID=A0A395IWK3_9HELO|nr:hypothetical protein DID88_004572 [Monilinia fructigena]
MSSRLQKQGPKPGLTKKLNIEAKEIGIFNRLLDMQKQIQSCAADLEFAQAPGQKVALDKNVTLEEFLALWQLAEAAAREIGVHLKERDLFTIQGYIVASVQMIKALQLEIQQKDVSSDYVMFLQQRNREGARVINEMGEQLRGMWQVNMPGVGVVPGNLTAAVGSINVAPPIDFKSFKEQIWSIYLGLFNSERNLSIIIMDHNMESPEWEPTPIRIDSENKTYAHKWELAAQLVRNEINRFLNRVWQLFVYIRSNDVPGSQPYWNGPYDDDHGRAIHVHEAFKAAEGRGIIAQTELGLSRQYVEPATDITYKDELEERLDRRYPIYRDLQGSINNLTQRITIFRQVPPAWPEQHERDNSAFVPKKSFDLLALMLSRIEMEYLTIRVMQLIEIVNSCWHLIPSQDHDMIRGMSNEISLAHGAKVACEAELTRPSEIAPAPAYPGKILPPLPHYTPKDKKDNNTKVRGNINKLEKELDKKRVKYDRIARDSKKNFAGAPNDASADTKMQKELDKLHEYRRKLGDLFKKNGGNVDNIQGYKK